MFSISFPEISVKQPVPVSYPELNLHDLDFLDEFLSFSVDELINRKTILRT